MQGVGFVGRQTMESELKAYLWPVDGTPAPAPPTRWRRFLDRHLPSVVIYLMVATLVGVVLYPHMVVTVPSGYVGVLWKRFGGGTVLDPRRLKNEGFNLILPWNRVFLYDLRLQSFTESYNAISSDGVSLTATVIVRFRLQRDSVPVVHQAVGPDYVKILAMPGIGSLTREVLAINMVMAGCKAEYAPVVRAAMLALTAKAFNLNGVQAVDTALRVLSALIDMGPPLMLKTVAERAQMPPPKAHRYLVSFCRGGLAERDPASGGYRLGPLAVRLGLAALRHVHVVNVGAYALGELRDQVGYTVGLAIWDR